MLCFLAFRLQNSKSARIESFNVTIEPPRFQWRHQWFSTRLSDSRSGDMREPNLNRFKTGSSNLVSVLLQRKVNFFFFGMIFIRFWIQYGFLASLKYDNWGLRRFAWKRARRPAKQPLLWFSDHWEWSKVELGFPVSGSSGVFHNHP